eukprot:13719529-Heterocapsa_arctica.AAC.1
MRKEHIRAGFEFTSAFELEAKDGIRSCQRGMGPAKQAGPLARHCEAERRVPREAAVYGRTRFGEGRDPCRVLVDVSRDRAWHCYVSTALLRARAGLRLRHAQSA